MTTSLFCNQSFGGSEIIPINKKCMVHVPRLTQFVLCPGSTITYSFLKKSYLVGGGALVAYLPEDRGTYTFARGTQFFNVRFSDSVGSLILESTSCYAEEPQRLNA